MKGSSQMIWSKCRLAGALGWWANATNSMFSTTFCTSLQIYPTVASEPLEVGSIDLPGPRLPTASSTACTRARQHLQFLVYTFLSRTFFGRFWHNQYYCARGGPGKWSALAYITDSERYTCHTYQEISCNHRKKLGVFMENHPVFL